MTPSQPSASSPSMQRALTAADRVVRRLRLTTMPVDIDRVAARLGAQVLYESLGPEVWGLLIAAPAGHIICVSRELPRSKQRAIIGHELGHIILRHPMPAGEHVHIDRSLGSKEKDCVSVGSHPGREAEASAFAGALLMPARAMHEAIAAIGHAALSEEEVESLARRFDVSPHGVMIRLSRLGIM